MIPNYIKYYSIFLNDIFNISFQYHIHIFIFILYNNISDIINYLSFDIIITNT